MTAVQTTASFNALHPRGGDGRFINKGGWVKWLESGLWKSGQVLDVDSTGTKVTVQARDETPEVRDHISLFKANAPKAVLSATGMTKIGGQGGSNVGALFNDPKTGDDWYVKQPQSQMHTANENLANRLYIAAGAPAPETAVSADGKRFFTKIEKSVDWHQADLSDPKVAANLRRDFVIDCWLSNWDAPANDNTRVRDDGVAIRVDNGGSIHFRARGSVRPARADVTELQSMRDPAVSRDGARMYKGLTQAEELDGAHRVLAISPDALQKVVADEGLPKSIADNLIARRAWLATHYGLQLPETTPEGKALLDRINAPKVDPLEKALAEAKLKVLEKAPDKPGALAVGSPVWFKNKSHIDADYLKQEGVKKIPDVLAVKKISDDGKWFVLTDGTHDYSASENDFELLRDNNASENAIYKTGELPQIGDRVDASGNLGTVTVLYPLYARVSHDDGSIKVYKADKLSKSDAPVPEGAVPAIIPNAPIDIGPAMKPEDIRVKDADGKPVIVFSLPHRVTGMVVGVNENDKTADVLFSNKVATVPFDSLYEPTQVDRDKVALLNSKPTRRPRTPKAPAVVDVNALPPKDVVLPTGKSVTLQPGDRLLKYQRSSRREGNDFMVLHKNGVLEIVDNSGTRGSQYSIGLQSDKPGVNVANTPLLHLRQMATLSQEYFAGRGRLIDITPPKYDVAAHEIGAKEIKVAASIEHEFSYSNESDFVKNSSQPVPGYSADEPIPAWNYHSALPADKRAGYGRSYDMYGNPAGKTATGRVTLTPGDRVFELDTDTKKVGERLATNYSAQHVNGKYPIETKAIEAKRTFVAKANGDVYDLGYGAENKQPVKLPDDVALELQEAFTQSQLGYGGTQKTGTVKIAGKDVKYDSIKIRRPLATSENYIKIAGGPALLSAVKSAQGYGKGSPDYVAPVRASNPRANSPVVDFEETEGAKALFHELKAGRTELLNGQFDDAFKRIYDADYPRRGQQSIIADGTAHNDPYMAEFVQELDGAQPSLALDAAAFDALRKLSGSPVLHRGVASAQQANDLKFGGAYFNGSGVYGNGTYTSTRMGTASGYGGAKIQMAMRMDAKTIEHEDAVAEQLNDISKSTRDLVDAAHTAQNWLPSTTDIDSYQFATGVPVDEIDDKVREIALNSAVAADQMPHLKAAAAYAQAFKKEGYQVAVTELPNYYSSSGVNGAIVTVRDPKVPTDSGLKIKFTRPTVSGTRRARNVKSAGYAIYADSDSRVWNGNVVPQVIYGGADTNPKKHDFITMLESAGIFRGAEQLKIDTAKAVDARISFIEDPGRWALAAGYDAITADQGSSEVYYIVLHRTAAFFKK